MDEIGDGQKDIMGNGNVLFLKWSMGRWIYASVHKYIFMLILYWIKNKNTSIFLGNIYWPHDVHHSSGCAKYVWISAHRTI